MSFGKESVIFASSLLYLYLFCFFSEEMTRTRREMADELDYLEKQLTLLTNEIKDKIKSTVEDVERKVTAVLNGSLFLHR